MKTVAIYIRISTEKQELKNQLRDLQEYCKKHKWSIYKVYQDIFTGKETIENQRQGFVNLFKDAH